MVPGRLACLDSGAAATPVLRCRVREGSDLSHRKSATTTGAPNEHLPRVFPATPHLPQPRFLDASRRSAPPWPGRRRRSRLAPGLRPRLDGHPAAERDWSGGMVTRGLGRPAPGARRGRVASCSGCPPWSGCALSGWGRRSGGGDKERRRPRAASARGPPQAGRLDPVKKL